MISWAFGDVLRVKFPFADGDGHKERPAVVVSSPHYNLHRPDIMVIALSSRLYPLEALGEFIITDWQAAGLQKPSRLKAVVATVKSDRVINKVGSLNIADQKQLEILLANIFGSVAA